MDNDIINEYYDYKKYNNMAMCYSKDIWFKRNELHLIICDEKTPKKYINILNNYINRFVTIETYNKVLTYNDDKLDYHHYSNGNMHVILYETEEIIFAGIIDDNDKNYLCIGLEQYAHPFYTSNFISYGNSDGSGPNFNIKKPYTVDKILNVINNLKTGFFENTHH